MKNLTERITFRTDTDTRDALIRAAERQNAGDKNRKWNLSRLMDHLGKKHLLQSRFGRGEWK